MGYGSVGRASLDSKTFYGRHIYLKQPCGLTEKRTLANRVIYLLVGSKYNFYLRRQCVNFVHESKDRRPRRRQIQHDVAKEGPERANENGCGIERGGET